MDNKGKKNQNKRIKQKSKQKETKVKKKVVRNQTAVLGDDKK